LSASCSTFITPWVYEFIHWRKRWNIWNDMLLSILSRIIHPEMGLCIWNAIYDTQKGGRLRLHHKI
jgi:hypothetical protein